MALGVNRLGFSLTYQNLLFCRVPIISKLGLIVRTYKKVGFGSLRLGSRKRSGLQQLVIVQCCSYKACYTCTWRMMAP